MDPRRVVGEEYRCDGGVDVAGLACERLESGKSSDEVRAALHLFVSFPFRLLFFWPEVPMKGGMVIIFPDNYFIPLFYWSTRKVHVCNGISQPHLSMYRRR